MKRLGWSWPGGPLVCAVVVLLGAGMLPASGVGAAHQPSSATALSATRLSGFSTVRGSVRTGGELWSTVTVSPAAVRTVSVQYRRAATTRFTTAASARTSALGRITVGLKPPAAGTWQFRVVVAASAQATGAVSPMRTVVASGRADATTVSGFSTAAATVGVGHTVTDDVVILPRSARLVNVQARLLGTASFVTQTTGRASSTGAFRAVYRPTSPGRWTYRLVVPATATATEAVSPARTITAVDMTAPGPVTALAASASTSTSITLSWTNPSNGDFAGVLIRRAAGSSPPTTPTAGTPVVDTTGAAAAFTDAGLQPGTVYSYALFAHDGIPNHALAATVSATTQAASDTSAPGPVTGLHTTDVTRISITLAWTNPADADFAGVIIRRADGATPPVTVTDGTAIADLATPAASFTDQGLAAGTQYSYAVFARDAVPNNATPTNLTVTTTAAQSVGPPTASLAIRQYFGPETTKLTVGETGGFDASGSFAADAASIASGSLDYGDGSAPDTFGPDGYWGTLHSYTSTGPKTVTLTVTDSAGATGTATATVTVFDPPSASLRVTSGPAQVGVPVTLAMDATTPTDTQFSSYALYVSGAETFTLRGATAPPATQDITFTIPGSYTVEFSATNDADGSAAATAVVIDVAGA